MTDQLDLLAGDAPETKPSSYRVDALASVIAGFVTPGYKNWAAVPKRVRQPCLAAAQEALERVAREVPPEHRQPTPRGGPA